MRLNIHRSKVSEVANLELINVQGFAVASWLA
jgi:hypothetical protein